MPDFLSTGNEEYKSFLHNIKNKIGLARARAMSAVNSELIQLYWDIGSKIREKQKQSAWGSRFLETLSDDLAKHYPGTYGFSVTNLKRMRMLAEMYPNEIGSQAVTQLPWGHVIVLLFSVKLEKEREWYASKAIENTWSRAELEKNVKRNLFDQLRKEHKTSNFLTNLPEPQSVLALDLLKNPYNLDFLGLQDHFIEKDIEQGAIKHISQFLLELGKGFAFVGNQFPIKLEKNQYYIDMLFYHTKLHCYVVVEFKSTSFKPEHAGQLNFYLNLVDEFIKDPIDNPSIGILMCKGREKIVAEYALRGVNKPIGVAEFELSNAVPKQLETNLPSIEEIENELADLENRKTDS